MNNDIKHLIIEAITRRDMLRGAGALAAKSALPNVSLPSVDISKLSDVHRGFLHLIGHWDEAAKIVSRNYSEEVENTLFAKHPILSGIFKPDITSKVAGRIGEWFKEKESQGKKVDYYDYENPKNFLTDKEKEENDRFTKNMVGEVGSFRDKMKAIGRADLANHPSLLNFTKGDHHTDEILDHLLKMPKAEFDGHAGIFASDVGSYGAEDLNEHVFGKEYWKDSKAYGDRTDKFDKMFEKRFPMDPDEYRREQFIDSADENFDNKALQRPKSTIRFGRVKKMVTPSGVAYQGRKRRTGYYGL